MIKTFVFRLTAEGVEELVAQLKAAGTEGQKTFDDLLKKVPAVGAVFDQFKSKVDAARKSMEDTARAKFTSLEGALDPTIAKQQAFSKGEATIAAALSAGVATKAEAAHALDLLKDRYVEANGAARLFAGGAGLAREALGSLGLVFGVGEVVSFAREIFTATAELKHQAEQAQVTTDELQVYRNVLRDTGNQAEDADTFIKKINLTLGQAVGGNDAARQSFRGLGLDWRVLEQMPFAERLHAVAVALDTMGNSTARSREITALFGRSGQDLISALHQLTREYADLHSEQQAGGELIDAKSIDNADKVLTDFQNDWTRLKVALASPIVATVQLLFDTPSISHAEKGGLLSSILLPGIPTMSPGVVSTIPEMVQAYLTHLFGLSASQKPAAPHTAPSHGVPGGGFGAPDDDKALSGVLAAQQAETDLSAKSAAAQLTLTNLWALAVAHAHDLGEAVDGVVIHAKELDGTTHDVVKNEQSIAGYIGEANASRSIALTKQEHANELARQNATQMAQRRNFFNEYLGQLGEEADLASKSQYERGLANATIQAAQNLQKQQNLHVKELVQTDEHALAILGEKNAAEVESAFNATQLGALQKNIVQPLEQQVAVLGVARDLRGQELYFLQLEQQYGKAAVETERAHILELQRRNDLQAIADDVAGAREQNRLAGLDTQEAQRISAVLSEIHAHHGNITADLVGEVEEQVRLKQETERWNAVLSQTGSLIHDALASGNFKSLGADLGKAFASELTAPIAKALQEAIAKPAVDQIHKIVSELEDALGTNVDSAAGQQLVTEALQHDGVTAALNAETAAIGSNTAALQANAAARAGDVSAASAQAGGLSQLPGGLTNFVPTLPGVGSSAAPGSNLPSWAQDILGTKIGAGSIGGVLGAGFGGAGYGSLVGSVLGLPNQGGAQIGGALGGVIGSIIPGVGTIVGSIAGSLIGGLIHESDKAFANFSNGKVSLSGKSSSGGLAGQAATDLSSTLATLTAAGVEFTQQVKFLGIGPHDKSEYELVGQHGYTQAGGRGDPAALAKAVVDRLLQTANISDANVKSVITANKFSSTDELNQAIAFVRNTYEAIIAGKPDLNSTEKAMQDLATAFDAASAQAKTLGLDVGALVTGEMKSFNASIASQIEAISNPLQAALDDEAKSAQARLDAARKFGGDIAQVEQLNALERQQIILQYAKQTTDGLKSLIDDLTFGNLSASDPASKFQAALAAFRGAEANANATHSSDDIAAFTAAARALEPLARDFLGTTSSYAAIRDEILREAQALGGGNLPALVQQAGLGQSIVPPASAGGAASASAGDTSGILQGIDSKLAQLITVNGGSAGIEADKLDVLIEGVKKLREEMKRSNDFTHAVIRRTAGKT